MPTGTAGCLLRKSRIRSKLSSTFAPALSARSAAAWITGPSATGSLNGMPTSTMSAPASTNVSSSVALVSLSGSPSIRKAPNAPSPRCLSRANISS
jgi:hypothetical protein